MTVSALSLGPESGCLDRTIAEIAAKTQELVTAQNATSAEFEALDSSCDALAVPVTITISTITTTAINAALASLQSQLSTIVTALQD